VTQEAIGQVVRQANDDFRAGRLSQARAGYDRALSEAPDHPQAMHFLGLLLHEQGDAENGIELLLRSIKLNPNAAEFYNNAATALGRVGRSKEAIELLDKALALRPQFVEAHVNRAIALQGSGRWREAMLSLQRAVELDPASAQAQFELGKLLRYLGDARGAIGPLRKAVELRRDWPDAHALLGEMLLRSGDFESGWIELEWRMKAGRLAEARRFPHPQWTGSSLSGRTLLVVADADDRTTIQLLRFIPCLVARGAEVIVECHPAMAALAANSVGVAHVVRQGEALPDFDLHVDLTALPLLLSGQQDLMANSIPYLRTDRAAAAEIRRQLEPGFHIGIAWKDPDDASRSIPLHHFSALSSLPGVHLVDLQTPPATADIVEVQPSMTIAEFHPPLSLRESGLAAVAEFIPALDLVIGADTAVAHLAGALGAAAWVVLPPDADWRWPIEGDQTNWYPSMRLFHASRAAGWAAAFHEMAEKLGVMLKNLPVKA
jgi:Flp pilus assembly protein TadD